MAFDTRRVGSSLAAAVGIFFCAAHLHGTAIGRAPLPATGEGRIMGAAEAAAVLGGKDADFVEPATSGNTFSLTDDARLRVAVTDTTAGTVNVRVYNGAVKVGNWAVSIPYANAVVERFSRVKLAPSTNVNLKAEYESPNGSGTWVLGDNSGLTLIHPSVHVYNVHVLTVESASTPSLRTYFTGADESIALDTTDYTRDHLTTSSLDDIFYQCYPKTSSDASRIHQFRLFSTSHLVMPEYCITELDTTTPDPTDKWTDPQKADCLARYQAEWANHPGTVFTIYRYFPGGGNWAKMIQIGPDFTGLGAQMLSHVYAHELAHIIGLGHIPWGSPDSIQHCVNVSGVNQNIRCEQNIGAVRGRVFRGSDCLGMTFPADFQDLN